MWWLGSLDLEAHGLDSYPLLATPQLPSLGLAV